MLADIIKGLHLDFFLGGTTAFHTALLAMTQRYGELH